jgi:thiol-disulfide isomerase/thioredoxin
MLPRFRLILLISFAAILAAAPKVRTADLRLKDLNGKRVRLQDHRGQIVVLNFWATWCTPCMREMPLLVATEREYGFRGVAFIGASLDDWKTRKNIPKFVNEYKVSFPVWVGTTGDDLVKLGMEDGLPATAFIDQDGRIVARVLGEISQGELIERLEWLLGNRTTPAPLEVVRHSGNQ